MSAFIVSPDHINVIVSYFVEASIEDRLWYELNGEYGYMSKEDAPKIAQALYNENLRSVNARYTEQTEHDYLFEFIPTAKTQYAVGEIAQALNCLEYQSCETDDYHSTDAYKLLNSMRKHLLRKISEAEGWDLWEITEARKPLTVKL